MAMLYIYIFLSKIDTLFGGYYLKKLRIIVKLYLS